MRPDVWRPPVEPSSAELAVMKAVRRAKLFVFLRQHRHELFDERFQGVLAQAYADRPKGQPPVPPARLAGGGGLGGPPTLSWLAALATCSFAMRRRGGNMVILVIRTR